MAWESVTESKKMLTHRNKKATYLETISPVRTEEGKRSVMFIDPTWMFVKQLLIMGMIIVLYQTTVYVGVGLCRGITILSLLIERIIYREGTKSLNCLFPRFGSIVGKAILFNNKVLTQIHSRGLWNSVSLLICCLDDIAIIVMM